MIYTSPSVSINEVNKSVMNIGWSEKLLKGVLQSTYWDEAFVGGGTLSYELGGLIKLSTGNGIGDNMGICLKTNFPANWRTIGTGKQFNLFTAEWSAIIVDKTKLDNAVFFMGMQESLTPHGIRTSNDIAGFILDGDVLNAIVDDGGVEQLEVLTVDLSLAHTYKITYDGGTYKFYVDGEQVAEFIDNVEASRFNVFAQNDGAVWGEIDLYAVNFWFD